MSMIRVSMNKRLSFSGGCGLIMIMMSIIVGIWGGSGIGIRIGIVDSMIAAAMNAQSELGAVGGLDINFLSGLERIHLSSGGAIDAHVDDDHDDERYVEGDERGEDEIVDVVGKDACVEQVLFGDGAPVRYSRKRDARRADPDERDEHHPVACEPRRVVVYRVRDRRVTV